MVFLNLNEKSSTAAILPNINIMPRVSMMIQENIHKLQLYLWQSIIKNKRNELLVVLFFVTIRSNCLLKMMCVVRYKDIRSTTNQLVCLCTISYEDHAMEEFVAEFLLLNTISMTKEEPEPRLEPFYFVVIDTVFSNRYPATDPPIERSSQLIRHQLIHRRPYVVITDDTHHFSKQLLRIITKKQITNNSYLLFFILDYHKYDWSLYMFSCIIIDTRDMILIFVIVGVVLDFLLRFRNTTSISPKHHAYQS